MSTFETFTFMHLADAFIQSDLHYIAFESYIYCQYVLEIFVKFEFFFTNKEHKVQQ